MPSIHGKVALVTGASAGIGKATVESLLTQGAIVYAAARRVEKMKELEEKGAKIMAMDVTDDESMTTGIQSIIDQEGSLDILVNNAGYMAKPVLFLRRIVSDRMFDWMITSMA